MPVVLEAYLEKELPTRRRCSCRPTPRLRRKRARAYSKRLNTKPRHHRQASAERANEERGNEPHQRQLKGRPCIVLDDIIDTAGTLVNAAKALTAKGASQGGRGRHAWSPLRASHSAHHRLPGGQAEVVVTDTIPLSRGREVWTARSSRSASRGPPRRGRQAHPLRATRRSCSLSRADCGKTGLLLAKAVPPLSSLVTLEAQTRIAGGKTEAGQPDRKDSRDRLRQGRLQLLCPSPKRRRHDPEERAYAEHRHPAEDGDRKRTASR